MRVEYEALAQNDVTVATSGMTISRVQGYFNGGANAWLQLHDSKVTPANTAVPLRVWPIYTAAPFDQNFQNDPIAVVNGCVFVVSSTQATLTISASTMDIFVSGMTSVDTAGVSIAGDYTTADEVLQVWAQANPGKKLMRLEVSDLVTAVGPFWIQVHAADVPATNKIVKSLFVNVNEVKDFSFGDGLDVIKQVGSTLFQGCTLAISGSQNTYLAHGFDADYIRATYK